MKALVLTAILLTSTPALAQDTGTEPYRGSGRAFIPPCEDVDRTCGPDESSGGRH